MFDLLLMDKKPETVIVIDAVTVSGRKKGEIFEMTLSEVPKEKLSDFSLHQSPSSNLLKELEVEGGVEVKVLGMHTDFIPNEINPGLTPEVEAAVPRAAQWVVEQVKGKG
jgi:coenzyme F420 hydrogenase subunit delta